MGDIQTRPYSANYSGLVNQSVIAVGIAVLAVSSQEYMKRKRRGHVRGEGPGSRESWEFGYLFQGRSWARNPSPPSPAGWPLSWVKQILRTPEDELLRLRGIDATLYVRFLRGCFWFALLHTLTTFPILFPIHVRFSGQDVSPKSMQRASISSLVMTQTGRSLLWIHICLLFWLSFTWIGMLVWLCHGAFRMRAKQISVLSERAASSAADEPYFPHPHPQFSFLEDSQSRPKFAQGIRHRTVMVSNVPPSLRSEKHLREYFEYFMSRKIDKPSVGLATSTQPGFLNKSFAFLFNRAKRLPAKLPNVISSSEGREGRKEDQHASDVPIIDRIVIVRKMTELANLLHRREEILRRLETSHLKLAQRALVAVHEAVNKQQDQGLVYRASNRADAIAKARLCMHPTDIGIGHDGGMDDCADEEQMFEKVVEALSPFVQDLGLSDPTPTIAGGFFRKFWNQTKTHMHYSPSSSATAEKASSKTVWEALLSLPRRSLDAYQPLVNLRTYFNDKLVPSIDYYTVKLNYTTSLITEQRARTLESFPATSTAFVTFADPRDARKACQYLAVHPSNPLACLVTMAPSYSDLDWHRLMKPAIDVEFIKDWVVNLGVWGFTIFWIFPVTFFVGLVSIQNIGLYWPRLKRYLDHHKWQLEVIQSFLPTILVALLALLIPLLLLLIAKKAHTISTLSALHDLILTRYYKFLIFNVLIIFCVGLTSLQTVLQSFKNPAKLSVSEIISSGFPTAGPFYVGWMLFTTAIHAGLELPLLGLPLILYPSTKRQVTPRKRAVGIRPRTLNFYYWVPNHLLVIHILLLFAVLNPFVLPFGMIYFFINSGVIKNQLIHVYAKNYEQNGQVLLIRIVRYSLDGNILCQVVFMAYMIVTRKPVNVGLAALMVCLTSLAKLVLTRICRAQFEHDDLKEALIMCPHVAEEAAEEGLSPGGRGSNDDSTGLIEKSRVRSSVWSLKMSDWIGASYDTIKQRPRSPPRRPIPFRQRSASFTQLDETTDASTSNIPVPTRPKLMIPPTRPRSSGHRPRTSESWMAPVLESPEWPWRTGPIVTPHPKPIPWDDDPIYDLPYDNPYYTRAITNTLWLPRNPFGILDLDDTVDMKMSLTTLVSKGELGHWTEDVFASPTPGTFSLPSSPPLDPQPSRSSSDIRSMTSSRVYTGDEEIELPPVLAKRAKSTGEPDIERRAPIRRPSVFLRAPSAAKGASQRRPSTSETHRTTGGAQRMNVHHSLSGGSRMRSQSILSSALSDGERADHEMGFVLERKPSSSMLLGSTGRSGDSEAGRTLTTTGNITAHEAIVHEVMTEEEQILAEQQEREEEEEAKQRQTTKSWLTSWMFKRRNDTGSTEDLVRS